MCYKRKLNSNSHSLTPQRKYLASLQLKNASSYLQSWCQLLHAATRLMCTWDVLLGIRESIYYVFKKKKMQPLWSLQFSFTLSQSSFPRDRRVKGQVKASKLNPYAGWVQRIYDARQLVRSNRLTNYQNFTKLECKLTGLVASYRESCYPWNHLIKMLQKPPALQTWSRSDLNY